MHGLLSLLHLSPPKNDWTNLVHPPKGLPTPGIVSEGYGTT